MISIPKTEDPDDSVGARCNLLGDGMDIRCHRRFGHPVSTVVTFKNENDVEVTVEFNHRGMVGGTFYTW